MVFFLPLSISLVSLSCVSLSIFSVLCFIISFCNTWEDFLAEAGVDMIPFSLLAHICHMNNTTRRLTHFTGSRDNTFFFFPNFLSQGFSFTLFTLFANCLFMLITIQPFIPSYLSPLGSIKRYRRRYSVVVLNEKGNCLSAIVFGLYNLYSFSSITLNLFTAFNSP